MKLLITGGAGFIGSNLCEYFVGKGHDVTCLDNLCTGFMHNIEPLMDKTNFHFYVKVHKKRPSYSYRLHNTNFSDVLQDSL